MTARCALTLVWACVLTVGCTRSPTVPTELATSLETSGPASLVAVDSQSRVGPAASGTIAIVQGSIVATFEPELSGTASLQGSRGFRLDARLGDGVHPGFQCRVAGDCTPGTIIPLLGSWAGSDVRGTARIQGQTFTDLGDPRGDPGTGAQIILSGEMIMPPQAETATLTVPFELEGVFSSPAGGGPLGGRGIATVFLRWSEIDLAWHVTGARFDIKGQQPLR